jgi:hypothetical protein
MECGLKFKKYIELYPPSIFDPNFRKWHGYYDLQRRKQAALNALGREFLTGIKARLHENLLGSITFLH